MDSIHILPDLECLQTFQQRKLSEEKHVVHHEAKERFELKVRWSAWIELYNLLYLFYCAIFLDEVDPRSKFIYDLSIQRFERSFALSRLGVRIKDMECQPKV